MDQEVCLLYRIEKDMRSEERASSSKKKNHQPSYTMQCVRSICRVLVWCRSCIRADAAENARYDM